MAGRKKAIQVELFTGLTMYVLYVLIIIIDTFKCPCASIRSFSGYATVSNSALFVTI